MTELPFIQEIRANPEDTIPRLIYADWLEENGDPLAELIRVQCELAESGPGSDSYVELKRRQSELLVEHDKRVLQPLKKYSLHHIDVARGFVESIRIDAPTLLKHASEIVSLIPGLCSMTIRKAKPHWKKLLSLPELKHVPSLTFRAAGIDDEQLIQLLNCKHLTNLVELDLSNNSITSKGACAIAECENLPNLQSLSLTRNPIRSVGLNAICRSPLRRSLTKLHVQECDINNIDRRLKQPLPNLRELNIGRNRGANDVLAGFLDSDRPLSSLDVSEMTFDPDVLSNCSLPNLRRLNVKGTELGSGGLADILKTAQIAGLQQLEAVRCCSDGRAGHKQFAESQLRNLRYLDISHNSLSPTPIKTLASAGSLGQLRHLKLTNNRLTVEALESLLASGLSQLKSLHLRRNDELDSRLLRMLAKRPDFATLTDLSIDARLSTTITSVRAILKSKYRNPNLVVRVFDPVDAFKPQYKSFRKRFGDDFAQTFQFTK
jgi:uncharacterized protein (TIGR02996 family)